jgi:hypothetical protein
VVVVEQRRVTAEALRAEELLGIELAVRAAVLSVALMGYIA